MIELLNDNPGGIFFIFVIALVILGCVYHCAMRVIDAYTDIKIAKLTGKDPREIDHE